jgi:Signal peptidase subunit
MHSALQRAQNVFGYFTTVASLVAAVIAVSVLIVPQTPQASVKLRNVQVYVSQRNREDTCNILTSTKSKRSPTLLQREA